MTGNSEWSHDALAEDLAGHLVTPDRMVWTDMQLGPQGSPRPDVYTVMKSFVAPNPTAYECKISVSDFRADVTIGKWSTYLQYAHAVVFAAPVGLIAKTDIPEMCGLIVRHEKAWRMAKKATINPRPIAQDALLKLLIDGVRREGPRERAKRWHNEDTFREFSKRFGSTAARYVADAASIHKDLKTAEERRADILQRAEQEAAEIRRLAEAEAPRLWAELLQVLGLESDAHRFTVERAIREMRTLRDGGKEARALRSILTGMQRTLANHSEYIRDSGVV